MIALVTGSQMRALDQATIGEYGLPGLVLMELAGRALAEVARQMLGGSRHVTVVCGKGNNGGDGFVAARWLARWHVVPEVFLAASPDELHGEARANYELYRKLGRAVELLSEPTGMALLTGSLRRSGLVIDALLGTGIGGAPRGTYAEAISAVNASGTRVLCADLPSGTDADTGAAYEPHVRGARTVTFGAWKRGLAVYPAAAAAGEVSLADIGIPAALVDGLGRLPGLLEPSDVAIWLPPRPADAHKGTAGRVVIVGGSAGMGGAVALAGRAALRAGAGLVTLAVPDCLADAMEVASLECMSRPLRDGPDGQFAPKAFAELADVLGRADAVAIGCGMGRGEGCAEMLEQVLRGTEAPVVIDADGLSLLAARPALARSARGGAVLTPHPGEAARLLETDPAAVQADRYQAAVALAERYRSVAVLKGARTIVADPDGRLAVNPTGCQAMATGGIGDVLAGTVAALCAQGLEAFAAACAGAWLHGRAGELAADGTEAGLLAGEVAEALPRARLEIRRTSFGRDALTY